jgi:predicted ATPase
VLPGFELSRTHQQAVGEICSRLDGLPLAIELAVARLRVLTPEQIRDRLADTALLTRGPRTAPARQQTLRGCLEWSHDLCTPDERLLWARLSVFAGYFDLDAAEGVAADACLSTGKPPGAGRVPDGEVHPGPRAGTGRRDGVPDAGEHPHLRSGATGRDR